MPDANAWLPAHHPPELCGDGLVAGLLLQGLGIEAVQRAEQSHLTDFAADPRLVRDPVHFPGFSSIIRKRLFEVRRIRGQVRPDVSNQYGFAIDRILSVKLAASILEFPHLRWIQLAVLAIGPIK